MIWKERFDTEPFTEDNKFQFINLSLFYAEMFVRVKAVSYCSNFCLSNLLTNGYGLGEHSIQRVGSCNSGIYQKAA